MISKKTTEELIVSLSQELRILSFVNYKSIIEQNKPFDDNLLELLNAEKYRRVELRRSKLIKAAGFPQVKTFDTFNLNNDLLPYVNCEEIRNLITLDFIRNNEDIIAIGPPGMGKTHLAIALGYEAIKKGFKVLFKNADSMINEMIEAKSEKILENYFDKIKKIDLLIIDELGYLTYNNEHTNLLFRIISSRHENRSTIITTNHEFKKWNEFINEGILLHALIDRLIHHSYIINMNGEMGYRLRNSRSRKNKSKP
jgi:DNA replication protein DnaC